MADTNVRPPGDPGEGPIPSRAPSPHRAAATAELPRPPDDLSPLEPLTRPWDLYDCNALILEGPDDPPSIWGAPMPRLTRAQYDVLSELDRAFPGGLTKGELERASGRPSAVMILRALLRSDPSWGDVIAMPRGNGHGGYRLRPIRRRGPPRPTSVQVGPPFRHGRARCTDGNLNATPARFNLNNLPLDIIRWSITSIIGRWPTTCGRPPGIRSVLAKLHAS